MKLDEEAQQASLHYLGRWMILKKQGPLQREWEPYNS